MAPKKTSVTITYTHPGTQPPIYLAGSFSEPPWYPQEMDFTTEQDNKHRFYKEVVVDEGARFQYKFRIGSGDWWVLDENASTGTFMRGQYISVAALVVQGTLTYDGSFWTDFLRTLRTDTLTRFIVTDEAGNRNNLLCVPVTEENATQIPIPDSPVFRLESCTPAPEVVVENMEAESEPKSEQEVSLISHSQESSGSDKEMHEDQLACPVDRSEIDKLSYARTAAEVADSAAILDREPSPVPLSNEEASRIGERRLSATPIPEVAETAAKVADSAAIIDNDVCSGRLPT
jgi:hypothetical protein